MPAYRLVTADGVCTFTPKVVERLQSILQTAVDTEISS
jgi:hypothetical protein